VVASPYCVHRERLNGGVLGPVERLDPEVTRVRVSGPWGEGGGVACSLRGRPFSPSLLQPGGRVGNSQTPLYAKVNLRKHKREVFAGRGGKR